ncbi:hypothetical protein ACFQMH_07250 [Streptomyces viridiviolaceus]|uniref:Uncharacterized protein n=1 Tax=Streptomyces viridiviolaceus TaxID=68282 RepID=A0ABW2DUL1_9ACTN|nr:hypothetical protein [Streptomyces viridiviolaceus]
MTSALEQVALRARSGLLAPHGVGPKAVRRLSEEPAHDGHGAPDRAVRAASTARPTASAPPQDAAGRTSSRTVRQHGVDAINFSNEAMQSGQ